jgi:hypothetical protein
MVTKTTLENGVQVITEEIPSVHSVSVGIWVRAGSRDEDWEENGISHFIEHMLFKGTKRRSARQIAKEIDSVGGVLNAFTSKEFSSFYAKVLADHLPIALDRSAGIAKLYRVQKLPQTVVIGSDGRIQAAHGPLPSDDSIKLLTVLDRLLAGSNPSTQPGRQADR